MSRREEMLKLLGEMEVSTPVNKPATAQKKPEKETAKIPNVQTSADGKTKATGQVVVSGPNKPATAQKKPEKETAKIPNVQTSERQPTEDEDPILKLAVESMRSMKRHHPFE